MCGSLETIDKHEYTERKQKCIEEGPRTGSRKVAILLDVERNRELWGKHSPDMEVLLTAVVSMWTFSFSVRIYTFRRLGERRDGWQRLYVLELKHVM